MIENVYGDKIEMRSNYQRKVDKKQIPTCNIMGVNIAAINMEWLLEYLDKNLDDIKGDYICVSNVHTTVLFEAVIFGTGSVKNDSKKEIKNYRKYLDKKKRCVYTVYALCPRIVELIMKRRNELK